MSKIWSACMQVVDVEQQAFVARATEFSEECELLCFAPVGDTAGDWGNELIAGAVHGSVSSLYSCCHHLVSCLSMRDAMLMAALQAGSSCPNAIAWSMVHLNLFWYWGLSDIPLAAGFCLTCYSTGLPSLCYHKATTATAALCMFDLRASINMVASWHPVNDHLPDLLTIAHHTVCMLLCTTSAMCWSFEGRSAPR